MSNPFGNRCKMSNLSHIDFENPSRDDLIAILECKQEDILEIMALANSKRDRRASCRERV